MNAFSISVSANEGSLRWGYVGGGGAAAASAAALGLKSGHTQRTPWWAMEGYLRAQARGEEATWKWDEGVKSMGSK